MRVPMSAGCASTCASTRPPRRSPTRLSISTAEVNGVERRRRATATSSLFRVGHVLEAGKHPNADRLQLTQVDVGEDRPYQIVCGAWNFGAGAKVAVALPGATLPNGLTLERRKLRGEMSEGMILAEDEVDLGTDHDGIMVLDDALEPGTPLADGAAARRGGARRRGDRQPPRPALASTASRARSRRSSAASSCRSTRASRRATATSRSTIAIEDPEGCPRYIGRLFRDVAIGESPVWLKARLRAAGVRSISNVVDVTNYVMLALGSPLHAFDFETLHGGTVDRAPRARRARSCGRSTAPSARSSRPTS